MTNQPIDISTAVALSLPDQISFDDYLAAGQQIAHAQRHLNWLTGDWINEGKTRFPDQVKDALKTVLQDRAKEALKLSEVASAFPPEQREQSLSWKHYADMAPLPPAEKKRLIKSAVENNWTATEARAEAMEVQVQLGLKTILPDDDPDNDQLVALARAWNRAQIPVRQEFIDMLEEANFGVIEP